MLRQIGIPNSGIIIRRKTTSECGRLLSTHSISSNSVIFSGIQPTGVPHIGNYLGALRQWTRLQDSCHPSTKLIFSVVDLHALTVPQDGRRLEDYKRETLAILLAIGLDPRKCTLFFQSDVLLSLNRHNKHLLTSRLKVPAHTQLMWILSCTASMGYLSRMTQWKVWSVFFEKIP
jgi:tryptophanyl-tRNA synthetase